MSGKKPLDYLVVLVSTISVILSIVFIIKDLIQGSSNLEGVIANLSSILFFLGSIFYLFFKSRKMVYLGYLFMFLDVCLFVSIIVLFRSIKISYIILIVGSIYFIYGMNRYLDRIDDEIYIILLSKILFFNKSYKYKAAWIYFERRKYNKSIKLLKKIKTIESYYLLAMNYEELGNYSNAKEEYTKILLNDTNERADILYNRGLMYYKSGKIIEAINDFNNCIKCKKPDPKAYIALKNINIEKR